MDIQRKEIRDARRHCDLPIDQTDVTPEQLLHLLRCSPDGAEREHVHRFLELSGRTSFMLQKIVRERAKQAKLLEEMSPLRSRSKSDLGPERRQAELDERLSRVRELRARLTQL